LTGEINLLAVLNSVDYVTRNGESVVFRTCAEEKSKVVFQIGTASAVTALKAAETMYNFICNMLFSIFYFYVIDMMNIALTMLQQLTSTWDVPSTFLFKGVWVLR